MNTNGGSTWTLLANGGGPSTVQNAIVTAAGIYYATDGNNLWEYTSGKWTELLTNGNYTSVAVNPNNANEIVAIANSGQINISYNGGTTFGRVSRMCKPSPPTFLGNKPPTLGLTSVTSLLTLWFLIRSLSPAEPACGMRTYLQAPQPIQARSITMIIVSASKIWLPMRSSRRSAARQCWRRGIAPSST